MTFTLVDSNVILDALDENERWYDWSTTALRASGDMGVLVINPIIYAEVSVRFASAADAEAALTDQLFHRDPLPWEAAFLAGKAYLAYRRRGGARPSVMPDFYIGAHAAVRGFRLLTRDASRYRTYFPTVELVSP